MTDIAERLSPSRRSMRRRQFHSDLVAGDITAGDTANKACLPDTLDQPAELGRQPLHRPKAGAPKRGGPCLRGNKR